MVKSSKKTYQITKSITIMFGVLLLFTLCISFVGLFRLKHANYSTAHYANQQVRSENDLFLQPSGAFEQDSLISIPINENRVALARQTNNTAASSTNFNQNSHVLAATQPKLMAEFSTYYGYSGENRKFNIGLVAKKLNGIIIKPGEKFSFNQTVGARTAANGFRLATVIHGGVFTEGIGGGVCQVSTTLYNCALASGLNIVEVHAHSLPVSYVKPSFDAMVSEYSDLVFENDTPASVKIFVTADGNDINVSFYGKKIFNVITKSVVEKDIPFITEETPDAELGLGVKKVVQQGKKGYVSSAYAEYYKNGLLAERKQLRRDFYMAQKEVIAVGIAE